MRPKEASMKFQPLTDEVRVPTVLEELKAAGVRMEKIGGTPLLAQITRRDDPVGLLRRFNDHYQFVGSVPLLVARALYNDPVGRLDILVQGIIGNVHPDNHCHPDEMGNAVVTMYEILTSEGLDLFIHELRKHEIID